MNSYRHLTSALLTFTCAIALARPALAQEESTDADADMVAAAATGEDQLPEASQFPRTLALPSGQFTLYEPQIEDHADFTAAIAWSAASYRPASGEPAFGAIKYRAKMLVDRTNRLVTVYDREILEVQFDELEDAERTALMDELRANIRTDPEIIPLDVILGYVAQKPAEAKGIAVSTKAPSILYASTPSLLVLLDGEEVKVPIEGAAPLSLIVNTNWDLFYSEKAQSYSLLLGESWLTAPSLNGEWKVSSAPEGIAELPDDDRWAAAKQAAPGKPLAAEDTPDIIVAMGPTELIVTDGAPQLDAIDGTELAFVANTSSDIVFNGADEAYYYLTSGRWFKAAALDGDWSYVEQAPESFQAIPADHSRAHVRASVAGTPEAGRAIAEAMIPQTAEVSRTTSAPEVRYAGDEPEFEQVEGTNVYRATNTSFDVFKVGEDYYLCYEAVWFTSKDPEGDWVVTDTIAAAIYDIPSDSPSHHVTYVKVYESEPDTVYFGYTPGYHYNYVSNGVVVYGSGYYWGSYYYPYSYYGYGYGYGYNPYYYYPVYPYTYGGASVYSVSAGSYAHGSYAYGPYGGVGGRASYNANTGTYSRSAFAYDYNSGAYAGYAYNPRTDTTAGTYQAVEWGEGNSYDTWGETVVQRDDEWVRTERYGTEDGFRRTAESSTGGQAAQVGNEDNRATLAQTSDGDLYAGANGNVFRKTDDGSWEMRQDGEWTAASDTVANSAAADSARSRAETSGFDLSNTQSVRQDVQTNRGALQGPQTVGSSGSFQGPPGGASEFQRVQQDWSTRTNGRSRYESFRSGRSGSFSGSRGGRSFGGRRRR